MIIPEDATTNPDKTCQANPDVMDAIGQDEASNATKTYTNDDPTIKNQAFGVIVDKEFHIPASL
jgi:hypothetical protein